jgi:hypothetical protein
MQVENLPIALRIETEADRLRYIQMLQSNIQLHQQRKQEQDAGGVPEGQAEPASTGTSSGAAVAATAQAKDQASEPLSIAHYVVDFGPVIKGTTRTKKFKITNTSQQQVRCRSSS